MKKSKTKRFVTIERYGLELGVECLVLADVKTGVNYLLTAGAGCNGLTPLLDARGDVVISSLPIRESSEKMDM